MEMLTIQIYHAYNVGPIHTFLYYRMCYLKKLLDITQQIICKSKDPFEGLFATIYI